MDELQLRLFPTFDALLAAVNDAAEAANFGVVKQRSSNYYNGRPHRYDLICIKGPRTGVSVPPGQKRQ
jgi:hypothetical protein